MQQLARCTCCHVCHSSEKTSNRQFTPCTTCNSITCRPCLESLGEVWEEVIHSPTFSCPKCLRTCPCRRCACKYKNNPSLLLTPPSASVKSTPTIIRDSASKKQKFYHDDSVSQYRTPTSTSSSFNKKRKLSRDRQQRVKTSALEVLAQSSVTDVSAGDDQEHGRSPSALYKSSEENLHFENLEEDDFIILPSQKEEAERKRLSELIARNKRLTEFIRQTETLLRLIRTEQGNIANQLLLFQKMKCSSASPLAANDLLITASDIDALATTALVLPNNNIHQQRQ